VEIQNIGDEPVVDDFWVDVYINPATPPTSVNDTLETLNAYGFVWGITDVVIHPGGTLQLTLNDAYFVETEHTAPFPLSAGYPVYAQVDSANANNPNGAILEDHEKSGSTYNNITMSAIQ
ncbi:MAG: hypothetical protein AAF490_02650, partial [Chloroflexota bacterium]